MFLTFVLKWIIEYVKEKSFFENNLNYSILKIYYQLYYLYCYWFSLSLYMCVHLEEVLVDSWAFIEVAFALGH